MMVRRAVIHFSDGAVMEFSQSLSVTELVIWLENYASRREWNPPPPNKALMAEIQRGYTEPRK